MDCLHEPAFALSSGPAREPAEALLDILQSPACVLEADGFAVSLNEAWRDHAGLPAGTDRLPWLELIVPDDRPATLLHLQRALAIRARTQFEARLPGARGEARWFRLSVQPLEEGRVGEARLLCIAVDIHALKRQVMDLQLSEAMQTDMLNVSVDCIKLIATDGTLIRMNKAGCNALGVPEESSFGMPWLPLLPEDVWALGEEALASARAGRFARFPGRSLVPGEPVQYWDNMLTPVMGSEGRPTAILCVSREVTGEREALETLRESQERLTMAARVGGLGIWDYDILRDTLHCDEAWYRIMGRDPQQPIRSIVEFRAFIHPDDVERATEVSRTAEDLLAEGHDYAITFRILHPNGDIRWVRSAACLQEHGGAPTRAVGFVVDVTDTRQAELALEEERTALARQNLEDPLTGIANRRHLDNELARLCVRPEEAREALCIGMVDVDHFKAFNDRYGHVEGDAALRKVAGAIQGVLRKSDVVARYGGEEFAFILRGMANPQPLLERLVAAVAELAIPHDTTPSGYLSVSCGCAAFGAGGVEAPTHLLEAGDQALYEAKLAGRNRYAIHHYR